MSEHFGDLEATWSAPRPTTAEDRHNFTLSRVWQESGIETNNTYIRNELEAARLFGRITVHLSEWPQKRTVTPIDGLEHVFVRYEPISLSRGEEEFSAFLMEQYFMLPDGMHRGLQHDISIVPQSDTHVGMDLIEEDVTPVIDISRGDLTAIDRFYGGPFFDQEDADKPFLSAANWFMGQIQGEVPTTEAALIEKCTEQKEYMHWLNAVAVAVELPYESELSRLARTIPMPPVKLEG